MAGATVVRAGIFAHETEENRRSEATDRPPRAIFADKKRFFSVIHWEFSLLWIKLWHDICRVTTKQEW